MLFAVLFCDQPGHGDLRVRLLPAHLAWLDTQRETSKVAGWSRALPDQVLV